MPLYTSEEEYAPRKKAIRITAEQTAQEDLTNKDIEQLLVDVHDELTQEYRHNSTADLHTENMVHAQKRLASLIVKNFINSEKLTIKNVELQANVNNLTIKLRTYTVVLMIIGLISISPILWGAIKWFMNSVSCSFCP